MVQDAEVAGGLSKLFKLENFILTSNMHVHTVDNAIARYNQPTDIIAAFFPLRLEYYRRRKEALLMQSSIELLELGEYTQL
jgi:DNA topoisomerase-2